MVIRLFCLRRAFKRQCTEDGRWLEGWCEPVTCPPPPSVFHGMYQCTDGFRFDSTCWIHCNGANHTLRHPPACKQVCLCFSPNIFTYSFTTTRERRNDIPLNITSMSNVVVYRLSDEWWRHACISIAAGAHHKRHPLQERRKLDGKFPLVSAAEGSVLSTSEPASQHPHQLQEGIRHRWDVSHHLTLPHCPDVTSLILTVCVLVSGEECELSCRDSNNDVVILPSNVTAGTILEHHWMNPPKVKVCVSHSSALLKSTSDAQKISEIIFDSFREQPAKWK